MELLAYFLAFWGLFIFIKGVKPSYNWISKTSEKELLKGVGFITLILAICFYVFVMFNYLKNY
jgi:hypothetical protein